MDISFQCDKCGQMIVIDEAGADAIVDCPKCAASLTVPGKPSANVKPATPPAPAPPPYKKCPCCAETIKVEAKVCRFCGYDLITGRPSARSTEPASGRASNPLSKILAVLVIIAAMVGGFFAYNFWKDQQRARVERFNLVEQTQRAKLVATQRMIDAYKTTLGVYELENGFYPSTEQGLQALITQPTTPPVPANWKGPYLDPPVLRQDPWGHDYIYMCPGEHNPHGYDLSSAGPNGIPGDADDITNWD